MWTPTYFVRLISFPCTVHGVTVPNDDGTFDIYLNENLSEPMLRDRLKHEISHICEDHFYRETMAISQLEHEANNICLSQRNTGQNTEGFQKRKERKHGHFW